MGNYLPAGDAPKVLRKINFYESKYTYNKRAMFSKMRQRSKSDCENFVNAELEMDWNEYKRKIERKRKNKKISIKQSNQHLRAIAELKKLDGGRDKITPLYYALKSMDNKHCSLKNHEDGAQYLVQKGGDSILNHRSTNRNRNHEACSLLYEFVAQGNTKAVQFLAKQRNADGSLKVDPFEIIKMGDTPLTMISMICYIGCMEKATEMIRTIKSCFADHISAEDAALLEEVKEYINRPNSTISFTTKNLETLISNINYNIRDRNSRFSPCYKESAKDKLRRRLAHF